MKNFRIINTGLFTKEAACYLDGILGQLSDGWGENNPRNDKYWLNANVKQAENNEVIIEVNSDPYYNEGYRNSTSNAFYEKSDDEILAIFARFIKRTVKIELEDNNLPITNWNRSNNMELRYFHCNGYTPTIADAYFVYDTILHRRMNNKVYATTVDLIGAPASDEEIQKHKEYNDEEKALTEAFRESTRMIEDKYSEELKKLQAAIEKLDDDKRIARNNLYKKFQDDLEALNKKFAVA